MEEKIIKMGFIAEGTTCESCTKIIKQQAMKNEGVKEVDFDFASQEGHVTFDKTMTDIDVILSKIEEKGYKCYILNETVKKNKNQYGWIFAVIGIAIVAFFLTKFVHGIELPQISQNMGYGLLLTVGLVTGFHCVAMCGGLVVSYTARNAQEGKKNHTSHLMYAAGKTISYTVIGAAFGLVGSVIAFTPMMRGIAGLLAGLFLILFGLKMLNIFPRLRKIQIRSPRFISKFVGSKSQNASPLVIGLLNGFMIACGPLQAIYIMAAGTGSMIEGAKILFIFAVGTLPVILGFGYVTSLISSRLTQKILKISGVVVILLGMIMLNNGLVLTGSGYDVKSIVSSVTAAGTASALESASTSSALKNNVATQTDGYQVIRMTVDADGFTPSEFVLKKGVPVKWIIDGKELTSCNSAIQVPAYGLNFKVQKGEQTIEFTPDKEGTVRWSCWMGMIQGAFFVTNDINSTSQDAIKALSKQALSGMACGGGGSCGCGMMK